MQTVEEVQLGPTLAQAPPNTESVRVSGCIRGQHGGLGVQRFHGAVHRLVTSNPLLGQDARPALQQVR